MQYEKHYDNPAIFLEIPEGEASCIIPEYPWQKPYKIWDTILHKLVSDNHNSIDCNIKVSTILSVNRNSEGLREHNVVLTLYTIFRYPSRFECPRISTPRNSQGAHSLY